MAYYGYRIMFDVGSLESGKPFPPVDHHDLERVWQLIHAPTRQSTDVATQPSSICERLISQHCEPGADSIALVFRAGLLEHLFQAGLLNDWCEGNQPTDLVFRIAAAFPIALGANGFDSAAFIERLRHPAP